ncbi:hypothetical protein K7X08_005756 [Anisodus acutangulus]|uniref:Imidazoleglycerol-phosphate dehydratase n=1 Tax=Anisodus acutangulus TaxID=402998 RepID=A0A9Q1LV59_9SOLA|nr:hypothetical protein K7X08_005756 [Anisodus acutangulus]
MEAQTTIPHAFDNGSSITLYESGRIGEVKRATKEMNVHVKINLDRTGVAENNTGIPFLDHMLDQLASHGLFDVHVKATGDIHIDDHHTNEDVALAIGTALLQALGDRKGINRFGDFSAPLDEALIHVSLEGHIWVMIYKYLLKRVGTYDTQLVEHFFQSLANTSGMTLHIRQLAGKNSHHIIEATFKAFARALRQATEYDLRRGGTVPSNTPAVSASPRHDIIFKHEPSRHTCRKTHTMIGTGLKRGFVSILKYLIPQRLRFFEQSSLLHCYSTSFELHMFCISFGFDQYENEPFRGLLVSYFPWRFLVPGV